MVLAKDKRKILGFLSVDNKNGRLATTENKEFLFGISDLLFNLFGKYQFFIKLANDEIEKNERAKIIRLGLNS
jgi:hypothetical protein